MEIEYDLVPMGNVRGHPGERGATGDTGEQGPQGIPGNTPHIGENGNWWIGDTDTGITAQGPQGLPGGEWGGIGGDIANQADLMALIGSGGDLPWVSGRLLNRSMAANVWVTGFDVNTDTVRGDETMIDGIYFVANEPGIYFISFSPSSSNIGNTQRQAGCIDSSGVSWTNISNYTSGGFPSHFGVVEMEAEGRLALTMAASAASSSIGAPPPFFYFARIS